MFCLTVQFIYLLKHAMTIPPSEMAQQVEEDQPPAVEALNIDDTSFGIVLSLVGLHLPCRDLIRLQLVSKEWQKWCSENAPSLWKARKRDNAANWYFPIGLVPNEKSLLSPRHWYGIHHPSATGHRLPGLEFLELGPNWRVEVLTSTSGLLLLYTECKRERKNYLVVSKMSETELKLKCAKDRVPIKRLIVCNPLTKKWRTLSEMNQSIPVELKNVYSALLRFVNRSGFAEVTYTPTYDMDLVGIHIAMNNQCGSYKIVIILEARFEPKRYLVVVYDSEMDRWEAITSPKGSELSIGSVCLNRRIYLLEYTGLGGNRPLAHGWQMSTHCLMKYKDVEWDLVQHW